MHVLLRWGKRTFDWQRLLIYSISRHRLGPVIALLLFVCGTESTKVTAFAISELHSASEPYLSVL